MPVKPEAKERMKLDGSWRPFCIRKYEYIAAGDKSIIAQRKALIDFYPPHGDVFGPAPAGAVAVAPAVANAVGRMPGSLRAPVATAPAVAVADAVEHPPKRASEAALAGAPATAPRRPPQVGELMSKDQALAGCDMSMLKSVKWVASVLGVEGLAPEDAPSPQAWSLYLAYRAQDMWPKFWEHFGKAMMPSKADIENKDRMTDDGREVLSLLDRLQHEHDAAVLQAGGG